jgi:hypothetical protein
MPSKHGGTTYFLLFKDKQGEFYKSWIYSKMRNFKRWQPIIYKLEDGGEVIVSGLKLKSKEENLIDADSEVVIEPYYLWEQSVETTSGENPTYEQTKTSGSQQISLNITVNNSTYL